MLIQGSLGEHFYTVGSAAFDTLNVTQQNVEETFEKCRLIVRDWKICEKQSTHYFALLQKSRELWWSRWNFKTLQDMWNSETITTDFNLTLKVIEPLMTLLILNQLYNILIQISNFQMILLDFIIEFNFPCNIIFEKLSGIRYIVKLS